MTYGERRRACDQQVSVLTESGAFGADRHARTLENMPNLGEKQKECSFLSEHAGHVDRLRKVAKFAARTAATQLKAFLLIGENVSPKHSLTYLFGLRSKNHGIRS